MRRLSALALVLAGCASAPPPTAPAVEAPLRPADIVGVWESADSLLVPATDETVEQRVVHTRVVVTDSTLSQVSVVRSVHADGHSHLEASEMTRPYRLEGRRLVLGLADGPPVGYATAARDTLWFVDADGAGRSVPLLRRAAPPPVPAALVGTWRGQGAEPDTFALAADGTLTADRTTRALTVGPFLLFPSPRREVVAGAGVTLRPYRVLRFRLEGDRLTLVPAAAPLVYDRVPDAP